MNEKYIILTLRDYTEDDHPFGNKQGKDTFRKLLDAVEANPQCHIFGISLKGIEATDASFPRESVISVAKACRAEKGFFLLDVKSRDLLDNWSYAANAKDQPLVVWNGKSCDICGPKMNSSTEELMTLIFHLGSTTAAAVAAELNISVPNASTRLKKLVDQGYILRAEETAESGGIEYRYLAIAPSA